MTRSFWIGVLAGAILLPGMGEADESGFTFKRVQPPQAGQKRITVQIAPGFEQRTQMMKSCRVCCGTILWVKGDYDDSLDPILLQPVQAFFQ